MSSAKAAAESLKVVEYLAEVLADENAALERLDFSAAVALVATKEAALADLKISGLGSATHTMLAKKLMTLAAENEILLKRAVAVQTCIVRIIARAALSLPMLTRYDGNGKSENNTLRAGALALSKQA
jgi:hypothetical protein